MSGCIKDLNSKISKIWDENVQKRATDLEQNTDITYNTIIKPWVLKNISVMGIDKKKILDIGCGCGYLSNAVYNAGGKAISGIDISLKSINYAKAKYPQIEFSYQDFYTLSSDNQFDLCLAVMTVNNMPNIDAFFKKIYDILYDNGRLVFVIPHPVYWPLKHISLDEFCYLKQSNYNVNFSTKGEKNYSSPIMYFHRSMEAYINSILSSGLKIELFNEIAETDSDNVPDLLGIVLKKQ